MEQETEVIADITENEIAVKIVEESEEVKEAMRKLEQSGFQIIEDSVRFLPEEEKFIFETEGLDLKKFIDGEIKSGRWAYESPINDDDVLYKGDDDVADFLGISKESFQDWLINKINYKIAYVKFDHIEDMKLAVSSPLIIYNLVDSEDESNWEESKFIQDEVDIYQSFDRYAHSYIRDLKNKVCDELSEILTSKYKESTK